MPRGILYVETYPASTGQEDAYNRWYSDTHLPEVVARPGFVSARRFAPAQPGGPYIAIYEMEADDLAAAAADLVAFGDAGGLTMSAALQESPAAVVRLHPEVAHHPARP